MKSWSVGGSNIMEAPIEQAVAILRIIIKITKQRRVLDYLGSHMWQFRPLMSTCGPYLQEWVWPFIAILKFETLGLLNWRPRLIKPWLNINVISASTPSPFCLFTVVRWRTTSVSVRQMKHNYRVVRLRSPHRDLRSMCHCRKSRQCADGESAFVGLVWVKSF